jgi:hypothetical protein
MALSTAALQEIDEILTHECKDLAYSEIRAAREAERRNVHRWIILRQTIQSRTLNLHGGTMYPLPKSHRNNNNRTLYEINVFGVMKVLGKLQWNLRIYGGKSEFPSENLVREYQWILWRNWSCVGMDAWWYEQETHITRQ